MAVYSIEFENSVYTRPAEPSCMKRLCWCERSFNSLICQPSMRAPPLAHVFGGKSGGVSGMDCGEGVGRGSSGRDTARLDALLHDVIHSVPSMW